MSIKVKVKPVDWNLAQLWNECAFKEQRPLVKRDYIYASEIGYPFIDRYYKMKAVPYTNPPNNRSLRKFLAGNIWEYVVKQILVSCGVYKHEEVKVDAIPYDNCLSVHGRLDFKAGGYVDADLAMANVTSLQLPDFLFSIAERIINSLAGGTLKEKILELKAVSTFAMDMVERRKSAVPNHVLQAYHYQKNGKIQAEICYICKDDSRMAQFSLDHKVTEKLYKADIEEMSYFFNNNITPPPAPLANFDYSLGRFSKNLGVEYSPYLTKVYGFETPEDYRNSVSFVEKWNRCLARYVLVSQGKLTPTGKPITITPKNIEVRNAIEKAGYNFQLLLDCRIELGASEEEEIE